MTTLDLGDLANDGIEEGELAFTLNDNVQLILPFQYVDGTQSYLDIVFDYAIVILAAERLARHGRVIESKKMRRKGSFPGFQVTLNVSDLEGLATTLKAVVPWFWWADEDEDARIDLNENIDNFQAGIDQHVPVFPDLLDDYYANFVQGAIPEMASEAGEDDEADFAFDQYPNHPEYAYKFWQATVGRVNGDEFLASIDSWIIPSSQSKQHILNRYAELNDPVLRPAQQLITKDGVVLTDGVAAYALTRPEALKRAVDCGCLIYGEANRDCLFEVDADGDIVLMNYHTFSVVVFHPRNVGFEELQAIHGELSVSSETIEKLTGQMVDSKLDWSSMTDERFEELCYDILYLHQRFDVSTLRKMGKSRSRDGSRDICVKTKRIPASGIGPVPFIFQCKLLGEGKSLSLAKLPGATNTIWQHEAKGYGVMTNVVIDATLYDFLDNIQRKQGIDTDLNFSVYELERFIARHAMLRKKYFSIEKEE